MPRKPTKKSSKKPVKKKSTASSEEDVPFQPWIVELLDPPGAFVARQLPEPVDPESFIFDTFNILKDVFDGPKKPQYTLYVTPLEMQAREIAEMLAAKIPDPKTPWPLEQGLVLMEIVDESNAKHAPQED